MIFVNIYIEARNASSNIEHIKAYTCSSFYLQQYYIHKNNVPKLYKLNITECKVHFDLSPYSLFHTEMPQYNRCTLDIYNICARQANSPRCSTQFPPPKCSLTERPRTVTFPQCCPAATVPSFSVSLCTWSWTLECASLQRSVMDKVLRWKTQHVSGGP